MNSNALSSGKALTDKTTTLRDVPKVSLIIPTRNEAETICECIHRAKLAFAKSGLEGEVIVADSSSDETASIAASCGARIVLPEKLGYGNAYLAGFERLRGILLFLWTGI